MKTLKLQLDFLAGPLWKDVWNATRNTETTGIPVVDGDPELAELDSKIQTLYSSYYEFDSHGQACWFNEEQEIADKEKMLALLASLNKRLDELNDGSFVVDDELTAYFSSL